MSKNLAEEHIKKLVDINIKYIDHVYDSFRWDIDFCAKQNNIINTKKSSLGGEELEKTKLLAALVYLEMEGIISLNFLPED